MTFRSVQRLAAGLQFLSVVVLLELCAGDASAISQDTDRHLDLVFACREDNDLYQVVTTSSERFPRFDTAVEAIEKAQAGGGVLILADEYPDKTTIIDNELLKTAAKKKLRLYVEYPASLPNMNVGKVQEIAHGRGIVTSDVFGESLKKMRIVEMYDCHFVSVEADKPQIVIAKVAGYDTAVFGLPEKDVYPILFEHPDGNILIATTKLSQFVTARYGPKEAWQTIWGGILQWLCPETKAPALQWTMTVRPSYGPEDKLQKDVELQAFRRGVDWFSKSRMFVHPLWKQKYEEAGFYPSLAPKPQLDWPVGDGSDGMLEGFASSINYKGEQNARWEMRADCMAEAAMAMAFAAVVNKDEQARKIAGNLLDFLYFKSNLAQGPRNDPNSPSYGLIGWAHRKNAFKDGTNSCDSYIGDEMGRALLGTITAAALLKSDRWNDAIARALLATLRTQGRSGFRAWFCEGNIQPTGWEYYWNSDCPSDVHSIYLWACYLWAYRQTGFEPFLTRTKTGIRTYMQKINPATGGFEQKMQVPLAWLIRVEDTPEHRGWLQQITSDMLTVQRQSGAIGHRLARKSMVVPSNDDYGTKETSIVQQGSDPAADMLYTCNFALSSLHEAAAVTGDAHYSEAEDRLTDFLCRIQIRSELHPELDGGWFRCFDYNKWEYWASSADNDWGPWCIETGWTQTWITSTLALRQMKTSLWDIVAESDIKKNFEKLQPMMLPDKVVDKK